MGHSIQYSDQTRTGGVGKCPNNICFIMQWKSIDHEACELCNTALWDQSHEKPLLILIHVLIAPLYGLGIPAFVEPNEA